MDMMQIEAQSHGVSRASELSEPNKYGGVHAKQRDKETLVCVVYECHLWYIAVAS